MAVEIQNGAFYCTAADHAFGPQCADDTEAANLFGHIWRTRGLDIRALDMPGRLKALEELRDGSALAMETHSTVACFCGSGRPWLSRSEQLGKPTKTTCENCLGTEQPEPPRAHVIDLFDALKRLLEPKGTP